MVDADSQDSHCHQLADAYVADKSLHYVSNGSSKQHDAVQMLVLDASDHRPLQRRPRRVSLADAPHVAGSVDVVLHVSGGDDGPATDADSRGRQTTKVAGQLRLLHKSYAVAAAGGS